MPQSLYFEITLEPHLKHSGLATGRKILFLAEVRIDAAKAVSEAPENDQAIYEMAARLAVSQTCMAMTGETRQPGEDEMRVSFHSMPRVSNDITERLPDAEENGVRLWLVGAVPE
ncbi:MAG: hypothetical protein JO025_24180 [Verrucomicrobia bacterium]|jgi:hypothetical protein|nr:hypothetical protein [Verrucomicrobiota bacterium]